MRLISLLLFFILSGCLNASETTEPVECELKFTSPTTCKYQNINTELIVKFIEKDEVSLTSLKVTNGNKIQTLDITTDFTFMKGDTGYILFEDINFDGKTDIAITTSFGTPNLYLNYWVYNPSKDKYTFVGNLSKLAINTKSKTLANRVKTNAAKYEKNLYLWNNHQLIKK